ncbi:hypothetical protein PS027_23660, partial [Shigella sonnei]|nr:hypothetical protein [Shigella sonnei]
TIQTVWIYLLAINPHSLYCFVQKLAASPTFAQNNTNCVDLSFSDKSTQFVLFCAKVGDAANLH